jgi:two-component system KDP operon response regulator KdpE
LDVNSSALDGAPAPFTGAEAAYGAVVGGSPAVLVVEDDCDVSALVDVALGTAGYRVTCVHNGQEALRRAATEGFAGVVLDMGLPDMDGLEVVRAIRRTSDLPIVVLSARRAEQDKIAALDSGADDFVTKPFSPGELVARVRAALRPRTRLTGPETVIRFDGLEVDLVRRRVVVEGEVVLLSRREHNFLCALAGQAGRAVSHRQLSDAVWGPQAAVEAQHVRVLVGQVRQKVEADPARPKLIVTEPGLGYRLAASASLRTEPRRRRSDGPASG